VLFALYRGGSSGLVGSRLLFALADVHADVSHGSSSLRLILTDGYTLLA